jgi:hypothetical protein
MNRPEHAEYPIRGVASPRTVRRPGVSCEGQMAQSRRNGGEGHSRRHVSPPDGSARPGDAAATRRSSPSRPPTTPGDLTRRAAGCPRPRSGAGRRRHASASQRAAGSHPAGRPGHGPPARSGTPTPAPRTSARRQNSPRTARPRNRSPPPHQATPPSTARLPRPPGVGNVSFQTIRVPTHGPTMSATPRRTPKATGVRPERTAGDGRDSPSPP